jgi:isoamylase
MSLTLTRLIWRWQRIMASRLSQFVSENPKIIGEVVTCLAGSSDLYGDEHRSPAGSINFITCHDGFTLRDLVSYNDKYNLTNGENNRDGTNQNLTWNCGEEDEISNSQVLVLRRRPARNIMAILFLSQGVPMFLAGDEFLHTQRGGNNAWCQNNEISWLDWRLAEANREMIRFVRELIAFRRRHPCLTRTRCFTGQTESSRGIPDVVWHGLRLNEPLWSDDQAQVLAITIAGCSDLEEDLHIILNMSERLIEIPRPRNPATSMVSCARHCHATA